ncbi:MAG: tetratricopeptide repeat protein [Chloroflexi bacterium]|nr:tetratricopeptide repeat protein [Chloroflexota bacterium]
MNPDEQYAEAKKLYDAGQLNDALRAFEQAHAAYAAQDDREHAAAVANDLGVVYYLAGRRDDAHKILQDALTTFEQLGNVLGQAKALGNLARLQERAGDREGAERNYQRAAELFHQGGEKEFEATTYRVLSQMQLQRGRWLESLATYDRALAAKGGAGALRGFLQIPLRLLGIR